MNNIDLTPSISLSVQDKDNKYFSQMRCFYEYLKKNTASRYMASVQTGIPLQNICRYVDMLKKLNKIAVYKLEKCKITGFIVEYLTTDEALFPNQTQLSLFE